MGVADQIVQWAAEDRDFAAAAAEQVPVAKYLAAVGPQDARAAQSAALAGEFEAALATVQAFAEGWVTVAEAIKSDEGAGTQ